MYQRKSGGLRIVDLLGNPGETTCRGHEVVGQRSGYMLSQKPESNTETLLSPPAELTSITPDTGIEHNSIAGLKALHSASDFSDFSGPVTAQNVRHGQLDSGQAGYHKQIQPVECSSPGPDQYLTFTW